METPNATTSLLLDTNKIHGRPPKTDDSGSTHSVGEIETIFVASTLSPKREMGSNLYTPADLATSDLVATIDATGSLDGKLALSPMLGNLLDLLVMECLLKPLPVDTDKDGRPETFALSLSLNLHLASGDDMELSLSIARHGSDNGVSHEKSERSTSHLLLHTPLPDKKRAGMARAKNDT